METYVDPDGFVVERTLTTHKGDPLYPFLPAAEQVSLVEDDGGRAHWFRNEADGDCACRSIAIASGRPYREVWDRIFVLARRHERRGKHKRSISHPDRGVYRPLMHRILVTELGFEWTPTMQVGSGCTVHVRPDELPAEGRHVLSLSKHFTALVDGKLRDVHDPGRDGTRCVYGYWSAPEGPIRWTLSSRPGD